MRFPYSLLALIFLAACVPQKQLPVISNPAPTATIFAKTKGMTAFPGYFPFWWEEREGKIWLEITRLDNEFLYVNSLPAGVGSNDIGLDRGQIGAARVLKFIRSGNKLLLVQPNLNYRASSQNRSEKRSVEEAFAQSVLWGFPIVLQEENRLLIDFTPFLLQDAHDMAATLARSNQGTYALDPTRSALYMERTKNFPQNSEWESTVTFVGKATGEYIRSVTPSPSAVTVRMHHSFIELPDAQYKPRRFDPRSGYFETSWYDYSVSIGAPIVQRYIQRHRLEKKDPTAALSDPLEPIVYYMDPGVPEPIKSALLEGAQWWNQAFEAAGYRNAFIVKELPEDADPMDVRYNLVQWVHRSTRGWSYGSTVSDPRTGEIIKGHVSLGSLRVRQDYLIAQGLRSDFDGTKQNDPQAEEMALARLRQLSAHEIGHTLGLTHNFAASVNGRASVMDYPHPYVRMQIDGSLDLSAAYDDKIGTWDKRAILYGYQDFPEGTNEESALNQIITENIRLGLLHISDEGARPANSANPKAHLWDNGADAITELQRLVNIRHDALMRFGEKSIPTGRVMADLERVLVPLYLAHRYQVEAVSKIVGGVDYTYAMRGDGQLENEPIAEIVQERAFQALMQTLSADFLTLPESIIHLIPPQPVGYDRDRELFKSSTGGFFDPLSAASSSAELTIHVLLLPERLNRMLEQQARGKLTSFTVNALLHEMQVVLSLKKDKETAMQAEIRRQIHQIFINRLLSLAVSESVNNTVKGFVLVEINAIETDSNARYQKEKDANEKAQLAWVMEQIRRFRLKPGDVKPISMGDIPPGQPIGCEDQE